MPAPPPIRILLFGLDADLQMTREMLLIQAGYAIDSVDNWSDCRTRLDAADYRLVILCHTVSKEDREQCRALECHKEIQIYALRGPIAPQDFLRQIAEFSASDS